VTQVIGNRKIRVLVVDDSALARKILSEGLAQDPQIEVIGVARDPYMAWNILLKERPDVITLDVDMPRMDGVAFLREYMPLVPTPAIVVSALTEYGKKITIEALEAGAVDVVLKPRIGVVDEFPNMMDEIRQRVKAAARANVSRHPHTQTRPNQPTVKVEAGNVLSPDDDRIIAIGASAGGVGALTKIIPAFPPSAPAILIVQHMPAGFTASFAARLDKLSPMEVREARHGDQVRPGLVLVAPGGKHMEIHRQGREYRVKLTEGEKVSGHIPSVDKLFFSVARQVGRHAAAAVLTGMGSDGAAGLLAIRRAGGRTCAQDEQTSVVFGMPRAAWEQGGAERQIPLEQIPGYLLEVLSGKAHSQDNR
jgi:two-component system chemotaxis response regulator CheB